MNLSAIYKSPLWVAEVFGGAKSFVHNPILGSKRLNEMGLHRARVRAAAAMAERRRKGFAASLSAEARESYLADGYIKQENFLPQETFEALKHEVLAKDLPAREMRQGQTVTRMVPLSQATRELLPIAYSTARDERLRKMLGFVAGRDGNPLFFLQTVIANPEKKKADPQTELHSDTFHSTSKAWLFLNDVGLDDGPFIYVPGSARLTPERLEWEYQQSLGATDDARRHHALGSFRVTADELAALGYGQPQKMTVKANTLIVADTYGFHARSVSVKPTVRMELHGHLRRNPFLPWNGLDPLALPGISGRELDLFLRYSDFREKRLGKKTIWRDVGRVRLDSPAHI